MHSLHLLANANHGLCLTWQHAKIWLSTQCGYERRSWNFALVVNCLTALCKEDTTGDLHMAHVSLSRLVELLKHSTMTLADWQYLHEHMPEISAPGTVPQMAHMGI